MKRYTLRILILNVLLCGFYTLFASPETDRIKSLLDSNNLPLQEQLKLTDRAIGYATKGGKDFEIAWFTVKKGHLLFMDAAYTKALTCTNRAIGMINRHLKEHEGFLNRSTEKNDPWEDLLMEALANKGLALVYTEQINLAIEIFRSILDVSGQNSDDSVSIAMAKSYNGMGIVFAYRNHYGVASSYFKQSLKIYEKLGDIRGIYLLNSNIGSLYLSQDKYKEALPFFSKVQEIVLKENYKGDEPVYANFHLALAYQGLKDYKVAEHFFREAIRLATQKEFRHLQLFLNNNYARNLLMQQRYEEAEQLAVKNLRMLSGTPALEIENLTTLGEIKAAQGDYRKANAYLLERIRKSDTLEQQTKTENLLKQKYEFDHYKQEIARKNEIKDFELAQTKIANRNLWIGFLSLSIIGVILVFLSLYRKFRHKYQDSEQISLSLKEQTEVDKKRLQSLENHFSAQLDGKNKELASNALLFLRLNSIGNDILDRVKQLKVHFSLRGKEKMLTSEIEQLAEQLAQNKGWGEFEFYFEQVDKDFLRKLNQKYPSLTPREKQICILFNLGLSNKEIANLSGKTLQSIGMAKFRLKQKMGLDENDDMSQILQSL